MAIPTLVPDVSVLSPHRDVKLGLGTEEISGDRFACARMESEASPAKKLKSNAMGVETILRQTAEIEMVLVGMAALRGGAPPSSVECHLAVKAYSNLEGLVQRVAPSDLIPKKFLQSFIQQFTEEPVEPTPTPAQGVSIPSMGASGAPASASAPGKRSRAAVKTSIPKAVPKPKASKNSVTRFKPQENVPASGTRARVRKGPRSLLRGRGAKVSEPRVDQRQIHRQIAREVQIALPDVFMAPLLETAGAYIKLPIRCDTCKVVTNDTSNVLICDGCETGYHLRCLQMRKRSDIPERDWYCSKCEALSGSHSRPSVYGPLRRGRGRRGSGTTWILKNDASTKASEYRLKLRNTPNGGAAEAQVESSSRDQKISLSPSS